MWKLAVLSVKTLKPNFSPKVPFFGCRDAKWAVV